MVMVTGVGMAIITDGAEGIIAATTDDFYGEGRLIGGPLLSRVARIARGDASIAGHTLRVIPIT